MAVLTPIQIAEIGQPPQPFPTNVAIINPDGTPTLQYTLFLTQQYEWFRRLLKVLGT